MGCARCREEQADGRFGRMFCESCAREEALRRAVEEPAYYARYAWEERERFAQFLSEELWVWCRDGERLSPSLFGEFARENGEEFARWLMRESGKT